MQQISEQDVFCKYSDGHGLLNTDFVQYML